MRSIHTEIEIGADVDRVWRILTDFAAYADWNPFVLKAEGELQVGRKLRVSIRPPHGSTMRFRPKVLVADPGRELRWQGDLWIPGLFRGEHSFAIEPIPQGRVRFVHGEQFSGLLVPLLWTTLDRDVRQGFEEMNRALKTRAES